MRPSSLALLVVLLGLPSCATTSPEAEETTEVWRTTPSRAPDKEILNGEWRLRIWYLSKGSRSEGQHGELWRGDRQIAPSEAGTTLVTSLGTMRDFGEERTVPWAVTGWHFDDESRRPPSWQEGAVSPKDQR